MQGENIPFNKQLENHKATISRMVGASGDNQTTNNLLKKCLYYVGLGSNDYLNNYFLPQRYPTSKTFTLDAYAKALVTQFSEQITVSFFEYIFLTSAHEFIFFLFSMIISRLCTIMEQENLSCLEWET